MKLLHPPTGSEWLLFGFLFAAIAVFIMVAELVRKRLNGSAEITRKLVHIGTGVLIFFAPELFQSGIPALLLAVCFILINYTAIRFGLLKGMHGTNRLSYGTVYYPLSFLILVILFWDSSPVIMSVSILILAFADAAAAIVGENIRVPHLYNLTSDKKSFEGSLAMFATTLGVVLLSFFYFDLSQSMADTLAVSAAVALFVTAWEALSSKGFDNLTVPLSAAFVLHYVLTPHSMHIPSQLYWGMAFGLGIAVTSLYFQFLSRSGSVAVMLLASIIYGIGGWGWTVPIFVFFIASSILSKYGKLKKEQFDLIFEKTDKRDEGQVAANGGIAGSIILLWYIFPECNWLYPIYVASLAAVTADTWATEIGTLFHTVPRSIITFKKVPQGTSGGISLIGTAGGLMGAGLVAFSSSLFSIHHGNLMMYVNISLAGLTGSLVDSIFGATLQGQYKTETGLLTEKTMIHGIPTQLVKGMSAIDNDAVNWICAISGAAVMFLLL